MGKKSVKLSSLIDKAIFDYKMIEKGDRILIGASGGKDSTALIKYFSDRVKRPDPGFEYKALFIKNDFAPEFPSVIKNLFDLWQVPFEQINLNILERIKEGQKMNCYWCSTQRRSELINYAIKNGYNKIALGHHMDDFLETLLMNMLNKGELSSMPACLKYEKFPVTIIRPLLYVSEQRLIEEAQKSAYSGFTCTCTYQDNSGRKEARRKLEELTQGNQTKKERLFASMKNIQPLYLP
ncbi:MAG: tRNA 2-thiocytidine biosynthesis TtcA family protein [Treponema sp.]|nr:tRNA 2-thiocytidine biosynthesis TtcA family protein [Treponema sp.]